MTHGIFVSGTDTGIGKTVVATALLRALAAEDYAALGMKPVAAGVDAGETVNADVRALVAAANVIAPLADVNPYSFLPPIAPHLAARTAGVRIELERIVAAYANLARVAEAVVVEGAGGLLVPLGNGVDVLDIPLRLNLPAPDLVQLCGSIPHQTNVKSEMSSLCTQLDAARPGLHRGTVSVASLLARTGIDS